MTQISRLGTRARVVALSEGGAVDGAVADPPAGGAGGGGRAQRALGVTSFPQLLAIDGRGRLVAALRGLPAAPALERALRRAEAS
jgi:hypothetical protein